MASQESPLDEIQWRSPAFLAHWGGMLHSDNILWYFSESPFFDRTSNNAILVSQASHNASMAHVLHTRAAFEERLRTMQGLEFVVAEQPASISAGAGAQPGMPAQQDTGVWVIRKQTRRRRTNGDFDYDDDDDEDGDEITVHAEYFVVGENIYMAPTLADILAARIEHISSIIAATLPLPSKVRTWSPSQGEVYKRPAPSSLSGTSSQQRTRTPTASLGPNTPASSTGNLPPSQPSQPTSSQQAGLGASATAASSFMLGRLAEESLQTHMKFGTDFMDENPITGKPGEFHLSTTGRAAAARAAAAKAASAAEAAAASKAPQGVGAIGKVGLAIDTKAAEEGAAGASGKKEGNKTPKTPVGPGRLKRRKSKGGNVSAS